MNLIKNFLLVIFPISFLSLVFLSFFNYKLPPVLVTLCLASLSFLFISYILERRTLLYVIKRLSGCVLVLFIIASLTFLMLRLLPGGPFDAEKALPPEIKANIEARYNLDQPLYKQYLIYIQNLLKGDLGSSYKYLDKDVSAIIAETLPLSIQLGLFSLILAYLLGIPLGVYSAARHGTLRDKAAMVLAVSGIALPSFLTAPLFILFFGFKLSLFEVALWEGPSYYVLPVLVLGLRPASIIARLIRVSVLDSLKSDYTRTARSKGLHPFIIFYKHVLKNAFLPVLTLSGPLIAAMLAGSFIIEQIFAINGIGKHFVLSVTNRDYPLILAATLVYCAILVLANLIVDLLYSYFDPRIKTA